MLETALTPWLVGSIEHIGSTAIPGMMAKPIIGARMQPDDALHLLSYNSGSEARCAPVSAVRGMSRARRIVGDQAALYQRQA